MCVCVCREFPSTLVGLVWTISSLCTREHDVGDHTESGREESIGSEAGTNNILQKPVPSDQAVAGRPHLLKLGQLLRTVLATVDQVCTHPNLWEI